MASTTISNSAAAASPAHIRTSWKHVIVALIGAAVSVHAIQVHRLIEAGRETGCGLTDTISCDKVMGSKWGELTGFGLPWPIPIGYVGVLYFGIIVLAAIVGKGSKITPGFYAWQNLLLPIPGVLGGIALTYISIKYIGAECPVCLTIHTCSYLLFIFSIVDLVKLRRRTKITNSNST